MPLTLLEVVKLPDLRQFFHNSLTVWIGFAKLDCRMEPIHDTVNLQARRVVDSLLGS